MLVVKAKGLWLGQDGRVYLSGQAEGRSLSLFQDDDAPEPMGAIAPLDRPYYFLRMTENEDASEVWTSSP